MKILHSLGLFLPVLLIVNSCHFNESFTDRETLFNSDWKFIRSDIPDAFRTDFDDSGWRVLDLPHDYSIEDLPLKDGVKQIGPFSEESAGGISTGHVTGGTAWYRKHFILGKRDEGKIVKVLFDGVYMDSDLWINGNHLGNHPYGYTAFSFDLTPYLRPPGENNILAVQVKNEGDNSRWYSGSGIYRNVALIKTNPVFIDLWGNFITTPEVSAERALVHAESKVINSTMQQEELIARLDIRNSDGIIVSSAEKGFIIGSEDTVLVSQVTELINPELWCTESPNLYTAIVSLIRGRKVLDSAETIIGIRSLEFSPDRGFLLNGQNILMKGGCLHHDNGPLGAAAFDRAEYRKVKIMKDNGFNAIRTAHNPPSRAFLDACDRLGMLVMNESFDQWQIPKKEMDYHRFFDSWWEKDIESMVLRDRNHPSVIIWSIGNEIKERADSAGLEIARKLKDKVLEMDTTRPVTQGICGFWETPGRPWEDSAPAFEILDVHGYNYNWRRYEQDHVKYPERIIIGTESFAKEAFENWQMVEKLPYVIGDFVWTGMDYFGESGIGSTKLDNEDIPFLPPWPWFNAYCGDLDVLGYKKPQMYFRDIVWRNNKLEMLVHTPIPEGRKEIVSHWGWPNELKSWNWEGHEGTPMQVKVYTRLPQVRLELNGDLAGIADVSEDTRLTAVFEVPYQPGVLTAIGLENGREITRQVLRTAGSPARLRVTPERETINLSPGELVYFNIEVVDENGQLVPYAENHVEFSIEGNGSLQAVGNGNPTDMKSFQQPFVNSFRGRCQIIVRPGMASGEITVHAKSEGLAPGTASVAVL